MARFAVIGLGRFGGRLAELLAQAGAEVIAVDSNREIVESLGDEVSLAVCLDSTDVEALKSQGIDKVDVAVVGMGDNFEASVMTTVLLKKLGVPRVVSRAATVIRGDILRQVGADDIVNPERESAQRWCNHLLAPAIIRHLDLAQGYSLAQLSAPGSFHGKTLGQLALMQKYGVNVVAIRRKVPAHGAPGKVPQETVISPPMGSTVIQEGDSLLVVGSDSALRDLPSD